MTCDKCDTCVHWAAPFSQWNDLGVCKRHAPVIVPKLSFPGQSSHGDTHGKWPETNRIDHCGDWASKDVPQPYAPPVEPLKDYGEQ